MTEQDRPAPLEHSTPAEPTGIPPHAQDNEPWKSPQERPTTTEHDRPEPVQSTFPGETTQAPPQAQHDQSPENTNDEPDQSPFGQTSASSSGLSSNTTQGLPANGGLEDLTALFQSQHTKEIQQRWHDIQTAFVDDPHDAIRQAGALNDEIVGALTTALNTRKHTLEQSIAKGDTEQLRIGMRHYRQMLDQILTL
jgi:hypothetical protein